MLLILVVAFKMAVFIKLIGKKKNKRVVVLSTNFKIILIYDKPEQRRTFSKTLKYVLQKVFQFYYSARNSSKYSQVNVT